jgi:hypothetical protein
VNVATALNAAIALSYVNVATALNVALAFLGECRYSALSCECRNRSLMMQQLSYVRVKAATALLDYAATALLPLPHSSFKLMPQQLSYIKEGRKNSFR